MRKLLTTSALMAAMLALSPALAAGPKSTVHKHTTAALAAGSKLETTKAALRDLWIGHIFWVRNVVSAGIANDEAAQKVAEAQVVANAKAIAGAIEPYYGAAAREKLFGLLAGHYGAIKDYLDATIAKNAKGQSEATRKLTSNAGEIAEFLSKANPNLDKLTLEGLLQGHGGHHITQIQQLAAKDQAAEAKTWAEMTQHMYVIADALAGAIAKQFPDKFASN